MQYQLAVLNKLSIYLNLTKNNISQVTLDQHQLFKAAVCFINLTVSNVYAVPELYLFEIFVYSNLPNNTLSNL